MPVSFTILTSDRQGYDKAFYMHGVFCIVIIGNKHVKHIIRHIFLQVRRIVCAEQYRGYVPHVTERAV